MVHPKTREVRLRRAAVRQGLTLTKSRRRDPRAFDFEHYWLVAVETDGNWRGRRVVLGGDWGVTLDEIEAWLNTDRTRR